MPVHMQSHVRLVRFNHQLIVKLAQAVLSEVGESSSEMGLTFVGDRRMRRLNRQYRKKDRTTDVLAFAMRDAHAPHASRLTPWPLGDVVISAPTAARQARQGQRSLDEELAVLLVHGILHLCGYDHERSEKEARRMQRRERMILRSIAWLPKRAGCGKIMLARENFNGEHVWYGRRTLLQDAQKGRPARPQRVKARGVPSGVR
jgi:probable rRNA maturation factor